MKKLLIVLATVSALAGHAEDLGTLTFNKQDGTAIKEAKVVKVEPTRVVYLTPDGGGSVALSNLPPDLQVRFNYNPTNEAAAALIAQRKKLAEAAAVQARQDQLAASGLRNQVAASAQYVQGKVVQKLNPGLLVDCGDKRVWESGQYTRTGRYSSSYTSGGYSEALSFHGLRLAKGLVFITFSPALQKLVDGDIVSLPAFPAGEYKYTTVQNARSTIRRFSPSIDEAILLLLEPPELEQKSAAK